MFPAGSLVITQVGDRRATGTHYTPRKLAEEIVKYTLEPLCYSPGPADGADPADWQVRPAAELLDLKVLDPAMGSGAFLVSACRFLGERLVEAWERDGYPEPVLAALGPDFDRDDADLEARRRVAARCLYGVDRDEAAVELGKLSLWLVTLAKGQPFSFLDHALRCGDSLVGLISESQVEAFHLDPETGRRINARLSGAIDEVVGPILTRVRELREEIEAEPVRDPRQAQALAAKLAEADQPDRPAPRPRRRRSRRGSLHRRPVGGRLRRPAHQHVRRSPALLVAGRDRSPRWSGVPRQAGRLAPRPPPRAHPPPPLGPGVPRGHAPRRLQRHRQQPAVHRAAQKLSGALGEDLREYLGPVIVREASAAAPTCARTSCSATCRSPSAAG